MTAQENTGDAPDHYALLGVDRGAGHELIRTAAARELRRWNARAGTSPTLEGRQRAESRVAQLNRARRELLDPDLRAAYDQRLAAADRAAAAPGTAAADTATGGPARNGTGPDGGPGRPTAGTGPPGTTLPETTQPAPHARGGPQRPASPWLDRAWQSVDERRYEDALYEARKATGEAPRDHNAWLLLGWLLWKTRDLDGARLAYRTCIELAPHDPRPHMELGDVHRYRGQLPAARAAYQRAADLAPGTALYREAVAEADRDILRRNRADALYGQDRHREALEVYLALTEQCYGDSALHDQIGRCMSVVANSYRHYPADGSLPYIPDRAAAADVREWARAALSYELTDERLVKKLREDVHFADLILDNPEEPRP